VLRFNVPLAFHASHADAPSMTDAYLKMVLDAGADALVAQNRAIIHRPDARLHLPQIRCKTLVVCGEADQLTPPECSREIAALVPGAHLQVVAQAGHMLTMEQPALVHALLRKFLLEIN
jgi:pimeloyl-ACP methyl ester carboxylesterase